MKGKGLVAFTILIVIVALLCLIVIVLVGPYVERLITSIIESFPRLR